MDELTPQEWDSIFELLNRSIADDSDGCDYAVVEERYDYDVVLMDAYRKLKNVLGRDSW